MSSTTDNEQRFAYLLSPEFQIVNTAGKPLTGGWIEVYIHGTRVKYYCFSDFDGTLHPFQIPLDSLGSNIVLASPTHAYDIYIYNKFGSLVMSRYNVVPATNSPDAVADVVVIDSPDETINVTIDGGSNWHLEVNTDLIATASGLAEVSGALTEVSGALLNKKDKQEPIDVSGSVTKTVTNIKQNENGEIEITYEDIDLPQQVPNVNIISPSGTLDITSTTDPATNTKTFKIDVHKSNMDYFEGYYGRARYEDRPSDTVAAFTTYVDQWREYRYQGDFIANSWQDQDNTTFLLNSGLYLITASIRYKMTDASVKNKEEYIRIATGAFNGLENGTQLKDWSNEAALNENTIQLSFVRSVDDDEDYDNLRGNHTLYFAPYLPYGVNYAEIDHLQIVKLDSIVTYHGGPGPSYKPGYGIEIQDDVISVATGTVVTNNYFNTVVSSINNEINEINTTIQNVTGDITELSETVTNIVGVTGDFVNRDEYNVVTGDITNINEAITNIIGATGDYATTDYVDAAVSGLENYSAGQYISIDNHVINVTGVQPEGDYATRDELNEVIETVNNVTGDITNINEAVTNIIGATGDYATQEYVDEAVSGLDNYEAGQYVSIQNHVISVTGLQPAGDYATEQYVDEAVAAVTGSFEQVNSDWLATSGVAEILNKPDVFQLIAGDNIDITPSGNDLVISSTADAAQIQAQIDDLVAATGDYATVEYVDNALSSATFEQVNSDWLATSGVAEILNKPMEGNVVAGSNISIEQDGLDVIISATGIPSLDGYATEEYVDEAIVAATGMIPEAQVNADWLATSGKAEILNKPQEEAVEFEEVNLEDYALASAIPDVSSFVTQQDIDNTVAPIQSQIDTLAAATGDYATEQYVDDAIATVTGLIPQDTVTHVELADAIDSATALIPDVSNFVTQQDIDDSIAPVQSQIDELAAATGNYLTEQVNADWNATSGVSEILNKPETKAVEFEEVDLDNYALASAIPSLDGYATEQYVDEQIAAVTGIIPSDVITEQELADAIDAATGLIPDVSNFVTQQDIDDSIAPIQTEIDDLIAATGNYLQDSDLNGYATEAYVDAAISAVTGGSFTQVNSDWDATSGVAEILNKPESKEVQFKEVNLSDFALASAIPSLDGYATEAYVDAAITAVTFEQVNSDWNATSGVAEIFNKPQEVTLVAGNNISIERVSDTVVISASGGSFEQVNADWTATSGVSEILNKPESEEVQFEEVDLSIYALASAIPSLDGYATEAYVDAAVTSVTFEQVNSDWNATSGVSEILNKPESKEVQFKEVDLSVYALASAIPSLEGYATEAYVDAAVSGVSFEQVNSDWNATSGVAEILNKPESEEVEFETIDLSVYALASAVPDVTQLEIDVANLIAATGDYATEQYVDEALAAVTGSYVEQVNADWNATSGVAEILNKPEAKEVQFKEVDLSDYALASAVPDVTALEVEIQTVSGAVDAVSGSIPESESVEFEELDLSAYAPASAVSGLQDKLTGITDVQVVNALPLSPVATVLYLIPEA